MTTFVAETASAAIKPIFFPYVRSESENGDEYQTGVGMIIAKFIALSCLKYLAPNATAASTDLWHFYCDGAF